MTPPREAVRRAAPRVRVPPVTWRVCRCCLDALAASGADECDVCAALADAPPPPAPWAIDSEETWWAEEEATT